ncbi:MAG: AbrB/MazE/SpoVT family DNA-binding domain-containing protein [Candidatus Berkelbacteria bacterium]
MESENRKLIKFSNYSLCVTLPKSVTRELKWNKGDVVQMVVDEKKGEILIKKAHAAKIEKKLAKKPLKTVTMKKSRW